MQRYAAEFADFLDNDVELLADSERLKTSLATEFQCRQVRTESGIYALYITDFGGYHARYSRHFVFDEDGTNFIEKSLKTALSLAI